MMKLIKTVSAACAILISCSTINANSIESKKTALQHLSGQIQKLQKTLNHERQEDVDLHQQLQTTEITLATLNQEVAHISELQTSELQELTRLQKHQQQEQAKLLRQHEALAQEVRAAYQLGKLSEVKILLNQEDPNTLSRHLGYYRYLTLQRVELINAAKQTLLSLNQTVHDISEHQQDLNSLLTQKQEQQKKQESIQKLRQRLIAELNQEVQTKEQQLATLIANQKGLEETLDQIHTQSINIVTAYQPFSRLQGKLEWPVSGSIIGSFGSSLDLGDQHLSGVIIKAPLGTPVHVVSAGKVVFANWLRGFGLLVIVDHGNGYMSLYGRNQTLYAKTGSKVKSGDLIAAIGNTGGYETSSLYFEIRQNGIPVNPSLWCRKT
jgi:septal ring factor EnvC (AmiA/AmiB activator)